VLSVQKGICEGSADSLCQMLFIAVDDRFLGTDWPQPSLSILDLRPAGTGRFTAVYAGYREGDNACCPSLPPTPVTFTWSGDRLRPDAIAPGQCQNGC